MKKSLEEIYRQDPRYSLNALKFIYEGLGETIKSIRSKQTEQSSRHISGDELSRGLAELAKKRWGRLSRVVLNHWGINTTRDMGEIVYIMIDNNWMTARESDRIEDFDNVFDFEKEFEKDFKFDISSANFE